MRAKTVTAVVLLAVVGAACGTSTDPPATDGTATTTPSGTTAPAVTYDVEITVTYEDWFRIPGTDRVPSELSMTYTARAAGLAPGAGVSVDASGEIEWTVRCYGGAAGALDAPLLGTDQSRDSVAFALGRDDLAAVGDPDPAAQWTAGPAVAIVIVEGRPVLVHRMAAGHHLEAPPAPCGDVSRPMLVFDAGAGAMTQRSIVTGDRPEPASLASVLAAADPPAYVDGTGERSGWILGFVDTIGREGSPLLLERESVDELGGYTLRIEATVTAAA